MPVLAELVRSRSHFSSQDLGNEYKLNVCNKKIVSTDWSERTLLFYWAAHCFVILTLRYISVLIQGTDFCGLQNGGKQIAATYESNGHVSTCVRTDRLEFGLHSSTLFADVCVKPVASRCNDPEAQCSIRSSYKITGHSSARGKKSLPQERHFRSAKCVQLVDGHFVCLTRPTRR